MYIIWVLTIDYLASVQKVGASNDVYISKPI